jgi:reactive intermediate/imine deaminase
MKKEAIRTNNAPSPIGAYSQAIKCGNLVFVSGQIPIDPKTTELVSDKINDQIERVFTNVLEIIDEAGGTWQNIVKMTIYLKDLEHFDLVNEFMNNLFSKPFPARALIEVNDLPKRALIEVDAIMIL